MRPGQASSSSSKATAAALLGNGSTVRMYRRWPGKSRFLCGGRFVTGGEGECPVACLGGVSCAAVATWVFVLVPSVVYFTRALPHLMLCRQPRPGFLLPVASICLFVATVVLLLATCCSDPGIIPRRSLILATGSRAQLTALLGHDPLGDQGLEPIGDAVIDAEKMVPDALRQKGYRWCHTCEIVRPPRASHCRDCDHCVMRFDHHCPFVNNCIGQRNYHCFIGFTTATVLLAAIVIPALIWWWFPNGSKPRGTPTAMAWLWIAAGVGLAAIALLLVFLWFYHIWLVVKGRTTKEHLGHRSLDMSGEPTLFAPRGPRLFDPMAWADESILAANVARRKALKASLPHRMSPVARATQACSGAASSGEGQSFADHPERFGRQDYRDGAADGQLLDV